MRRHKPCGTEDGRGRPVAFAAGLCFIVVFVLQYKYLFVILHPVFTQKHINVCAQLI